MTPLLSALGAAGLCLSAAVLTRMGWLTPWLSGGFAYLITKQLSLPDLQAAYLVILCYLISDVTQAPDDAVGNSLNVTQQLANDPQVYELAVESNKQFGKKARKNSWVKALVLLFGFCAAIPELPFKLMGLLGLPVALVYYIFGVQVRYGITDFLPKISKCVLFQAFGLVLVLFLYQRVEEPNPLLIMTMIAGLAIPGILMPIRDKDRKDGINTLDHAWGGVESFWLWSLPTLAFMMAIPGMSASIAGPTFLSRSRWRPLVLSCIGAYFEGWNLRHITWGEGMSKTALAEIMNKNFAGVLEGKQLEVGLVVACVYLLGMYLIQCKWWQSERPKHGKVKTIAILLGQSIAATGVLWTAAFLALGFITCLYFRAVTPEDDDAKSFGFIAPLLMS